VVSVSLRTIIHMNDMAARSDDIEQEFKELQESFRDATQLIIDAEKHMKQACFSEAERLQLLIRLNYLYENRKALRENLMRGMALCFYSTWLRPSLSYVRCGLFGFPLPPPCSRGV